MKLLIFNTDLSKISVVSDGLCIRLSYLFANDTIIASNMTSTFINIEAYLDESFLFKLNCLARDFARDEPGKKNDFFEMIEGVKFYNKIKHKDGKAIAMFKHWERSTNELFAMSLQPRLDGAKEFGLSQLYELSKKGEFIFESISNQAFEGNPKGPRRNVNLHEVLLYLLEGYKVEGIADLAKYKVPAHRLDSQVMAVLQDPFLQEKEWNNTNLPVNSHDPRAANNDAIVMEHFMNLPNLVQPSAAILSSIKGAIAAEAATFNTLCNEWIDLSYKDSAAAFQFFKDTILPAKDAFAPHLEANKVLNESVVINEENTGLLEILIGIVPIASVIQFYDGMGALTAETVALFNNKVAEMEKQNFRIPVLVCRERAYEKNKPNDLPIENLGTKKYLDID
ncbi:MAG: hypothetical protein IT256_07050 [Chitinophagaceae bacterium]|nr:hypothetical protein [Chitinophagaceae bacterium]